MKKLFTLFGFLMVLVSAFNLNAQSYYEYPLIKENFNGWTALPTDWSYFRLNTGITVTIADSINFNGSGSGSRGADLIIPANRDSSTIYVDFDLFIKSATVTRNNAFALFLSGSNSTNMGTADYHSGLIASLYLGGTDGKIHIWNMDIKGPVPTSKPDTIVPVTYTGSSFGRAGISNTWCDSINLSTRTDVIYTAGKWYNLKFKMDFNAKKVDITITQKDEPANTQTITDLDFVAPAANDLARISIVNTRSNNSYPEVNGGTIGNGNTLTVNASLDNLYIYQLVKSLGLADVMVNYQDLEGSTIKTSRVETSQEVGVTYKLLDSDIASFTDNGNYYAYDAVATGSESVVVEAGGSSITVKFKKTPITTGTYVWKGTFSEYWNELDPNFSTDGNNQLGYQTGNGVSFSDANAPIKEVTMNKKFDLGTGNLTVDAKGYTVKNSSGEIISGTGTIQVNASTTLGLSSQSKMPVYLNKDTLTVTNAELASKYIVSDGTTLQPGYTMSTLIEGNGGTFTLLPKVYNYSSEIKGMTVVKYPLQIKGTANSSKISGMPKMYCTLDSLAELYVTTVAGDSTIFGTTVNYTYNKVNLGDYVYLAYSETPSATAPTISIGELSGSATSKLIGPNVRTVNYKIGGLNTDATFAGGLKPITIDAWNNRTDYNIEKVGKGSWSLSGNSPDFFGKVTVTDGTLIVNDTLCNGLGSYTLGGATVNKQISEVVVADTATLAGSGYIGAIQTTVNGTITGRLTLMGNLSLKYDLGDGGATTLINVNGSDIDQINILGDLYYGGKLIVKVVGDLPPAGDYQILKFSGQFESGQFGFDSIELPSTDWSFDYTTGILHFIGGSGVKYIDANKEVASKEFFDLTGRKVKDGYQGFVIVKVKYTDGTAGSYKVFKKSTDK
ncbi:exported hypothetical protein [uncultured Paludibacter sp.]|uniref:Uncharacterized protein n=1 Tax=uncultured Paludibacter sp. TaxID=497635 RepID=A0A653AIV9_9BACT|nr:exported hypothetical protein [uncultured Paludibacter sp.]